MKRNTKQTTAPWEKGYPGVQSDETRSGSHRKSRSCDYMDPNRDNRTDHDVVVIDRRSRTPGLEVRDNRYLEVPHHQEGARQMGQRHPFTPCSQTAPQGTLRILLWAWNLSYECNLSCRFSPCFCDWCSTSTFALTTTSPRSEITPR